MDRRELLGALGLGAVGLATLPQREVLADDQHPHHHDPAHGECLKACLLVSQVCNETFHSSFDHVKDGHKEHSRIAELTADCQAFAGLAAAMLARESDLLGYSCLACAEACKAVVEECKKHDDKQLKECLDACMACEKSCRAMAQNRADHNHAE